MLSLWLRISRILIIISTTDLRHLLHHRLSSAVTFPRQTNQQNKSCYVTTYNTVSHALCYTAGNNGTDGTVGACSLSQR